MLRASHGYWGWGKPRGGSKESYAQGIAWLLGVGKVWVQSTTPHTLPHAQPHALPHALPRALPCTTSYRSHAPWWCPVGCKATTASATTCSHKCVLPGPHAPWWWWCPAGCEMTATHTMLFHTHRCLATTPIATMPTTPMTATPMTAVGPAWQRWRQ